VAVTTVAAVLTGILIPDPSEAGSGLNTYYWNTPQITISSSSNRYSNMSGFVQAIVNSFSCSVAIDGNYGSLTTWYAADMQNRALGTNNGGVMNPSMLLAIQTADRPPLYPGAPSVDRLEWPGAIDAFGTQLWSYYGGNAAGSAKLGWNPISAQWLFSQNLSGTGYYPASTSRTISSVGPCLF
jgi:hypothetical protein